MENWKRAVIAGSAGAATILMLLGLDPKDWNPAAGPPLRGAFR
jgi:hypothetical protein